MKPLKARPAVALLLAPLFLLLGSSSDAKTIVERTGPCEITLTVQIEIWGDPTKLIDAESSDLDDLEIRGAATQEVADAWKAYIERMWNGPTLEQATYIAETADWISYTEGKRPNRISVGYEFEDFMKDTGMAAGCTVNCCTIKFVADVRPRSGGADDGTEGWHQIQAVRSHYIKRGLLGSIPGVGDYLSETEVAWFRSYVHRMDDPEQSTTGTWGYDPDDICAAHEVGHLLGLPDQYEDVEGEDGETHSQPNPGHEHDIMNDGDAYPTEEDIKSILEFFGVECDCCESSDDAQRLYTSAVATATDPSNACNRTVLEQTLQSLKDQMQSLGTLPISFQDKLDLWRKLKKQIAATELELAFCPSEQLLTGTGGDSYRVASDSTEVCTYSDGESVPPPTVTLSGPTPNFTSAPTPTDTGEPSPTGSGEPTTAVTDTPTPSAPGEPSDQDEDGEPRDVRTPSVPAATSDEEQAEGDHPRDTEPPEEPEEEEEETEAPKVTLIMKSTQTGTGQLMSRRQLKLVDPFLTNPQFALTDENKDDAGFDEDPLQCTTGEDGTCEIDNATVGAGTPVAAAGGAEVEVPSDKTQSYLVMGAGLDPEITRRVADRADLKFTVGSNLYYRLDYKYSLGLRFNYADLQLGEDQAEENLCRDKEPAYPIEALDSLPELPSRALTRKRIRLDSGGQQ